MKAAIALLANYQVQNFVRRIVFELDQKYQIDFVASHLPGHISLKQPFAFDNMARLEEYFDALAGRIPPFQIELDEIYYSQWSGYGIVGLKVTETDRLRRLHDQLNGELRELFEDTSAPHDGEGYHFHLTIELGEVDQVDPYRAYYEQLEDKVVRLRFLAEEIGLFYYTGKEHNTFMCYKVLPLTGEE